MKIKALGSVKNGELQVYSKEKLQKAIQNMEGCIIEIVIRQKTKGRSHQQNKYYWGVAVEIIKDGLKEEHGENFNAEQTHEFIKEYVNGFEVFDFDKLKIENIPESTATLPSEDFEGFLEKLRRWGDRCLNVHIPLPNEQLELL